MADHQDDGNRHENPKKKTLGKRRRDIALITNKSSRQVTLTKRRDHGLYKKAGELCTLCGAQVAVLTFSGAGKPFSFGYPSAEHVTHRFVKDSNFTTAPNNNSNNNNNMSSSEQCKAEVLTAATEVASSSSSSNGRIPRGNNNNNGCWWDAPVDDTMGLDELEQLKGALEGLRAQVISRIDDGINPSSPTSVLPPKPEFGSILEDYTAAGYGDSGWIPDHEIMGIPSVSQMMTMMNDLDTFLYSTN